MALKRRGCSEQGIGETIGGYEVRYRFLERRQGWARIQHNGGAVDAVGPRTATRQRPGAKSRDQSWGLFAGRRARPRGPPRRGIRHPAGTVRHPPRTASGTHRAASDPVDTGGGLAPDQIKHHVGRDRPATALQEHQNVPQSLPAERHLTLIDRNEQWAKSPTCIRTCEHIVSLIP